MRAIVLKTLIVAVLALSVSTAFAHQNGPSSGTHITVAKATSNLGDYSAMYTSIQAAVNNARSGQVIEILDESVYEEQVTIDGRDTTTDKTRWAGVVSGKNDITIKYVPPSGVAITARPTIKHQDTRNIGPTNCTEAKTTGDTLGSSGNFATNGAVRIIRASGITIEGLIIDGGGSKPFSNKPVWVPVDCSNPTQAQYTALQHGNAAVAVAISHNVQIRDCQLQNAYFGMYIYDRSKGGIFGNPNPSDNDQTIPLSGFGRTGNHLIEYNRIHDNDVGFYFESCWDLGSTVRYNLIYNNYHKTAVVGMGEDSDKSSGAIVFRDIYITPLAIYNNTFYSNSAHLIGMWQVGYQHLIFNNIFAGRLRTGSGNGQTSSFMGVEHMFPNRMKHCVFSADQAPSGPPYLSVQFQRLGQLPPQETNGIQPGTLLSGGQGPGPAIPATANVRWLETPFANTATEANANFLEPTWSDAGVTSYIKDYGWPDAGIIDPDGSRADLGAISSDATAKRPCDGKAQTSRGRVSPYGFVTITGTTAVAKITISQEVGSLTGLTIKYLRWITPVPDNTETFGQEGTPVPAASVRTVTAAAPAGGWKVGANESNITISGTAGEYGFFEIVFEGKDANNNTVTTDVGFLPYRQLEHELEIRVMNGTTVVNNPVVVAGEPVTLRVRAMKSGQPYTASGGYPLNVAYSLYEVTSHIYQSPVPANPLIEDNILQSSAYTKTYTVYFTKAMESEVISGAGVWCDAADCANASQILPFPGELVIEVRPGASDKVVFQDPVPKSRLAGATPPTISGTAAVEVQVQDKYDNAVNTSIPVSIVSSDPTIGDIDKPSASTDPADGIARFTARVTNGKTGDVFDLTASIPSGSKKTDVASLRVGRATDVLWVLYQDNGKRGNESGTFFKGGWWKDEYFDKGEIEAFVRTKQPVWVMLASGLGDTVVTKNVSICVSSTDGLLFSATEDGTAAAGPVIFPMSGGVANFWVTSDAAVENASISVSAKTSADCGAATDGVRDGSRGGITFFESEGEVSVLTPSRVVPPPPKEEATVIAPVVILAGEFTAGPNPVLKQSGIIKFYRQGKQVASSELRIYDATGNVINKIKIIDNAIGTQAKRQVGSWDLKDRKGRIVSDGTYIVKGTLRTRSGEKEKISVILGVR